MAVVTVIATAIIGPPMILIAMLTSSGEWTFRLMRRWARTVAWSMRLTFSLHGAENIVPGVSYIITPNHQSNSDILALLQVMPVRFRWVVKQELLKIPLFGGALAATGAIAIDRSNRGSAVKSLQTGAQRLKDGWSVLIYPEGTRTRDGNLQAFKKGAFMTAVQTGMPILPVTCNGAFRIMPKSTLLFRPGHITVTIGDPIPTEGLTEEDVPALIERTRDAVAKNLDATYNPFGERGR